MRLFIRNPLVKAAFITPKALVQRLETQITGCGCYFEIWEGKRLALMLSTAAQLSTKDRPLFLEAAELDENNTEQLSAINTAYNDTLRAIQLEQYEQQANTDTSEGAQAKKKLTRLLPENTQRDVKAVLCYSFECLFYLPLFLSWGAIGLWLFEPNMMIDNIEALKEFNDPELKQLIVYVSVTLCAVAGWLTWIIQSQRSPFFSFNKKDDVPDDDKPHGNQKLHPK